MGDNPTVKRLTGESPQPAVPADEGFNLARPLYRLVLQLGPLSDLISVFGPFVIPVLLFACGFVGYLILVALGRAGLGNGER